MLQALQALAASTSAMFGGGSAAGSYMNPGRAAASHTGGAGGGGNQAGGFLASLGKAQTAFTAISGPANKVVGAFKDIYDQGVALADQQLESNRNLRSWSAAIHKSYVDLEISRNQNAQKLAAATEKSASALTEAQRRQEQALNPGEIGIEDWKNEIGAFFKDMQTGVKGFVYELTGAAQHGRDLLKKAGQVKTPAQQSMEALAAIAGGGLGKRRLTRPIEMPPKS